MNEEIRIDNDQLAIANAKILLKRLEPIIKEAEDLLQTYKIAFIYLSNDNLKKKVIYDGIQDLQKALEKEYFLKTCLSNVKSYQDLEATMILLENLKD